MDNNLSFNAFGENFKPITDEEFDYESEYRNIVARNENPYADPDETEIFNNKILYAVYFFAALLSFFIMYACYAAYCLKPRREDSQERPLPEVQRRFSAPHFRRGPGTHRGFLNPIEKRLEEKAREDPNRLSEFVVGRDVAQQDGLEMKERLPSSVVLDDFNSSDDELKGATGVSKSLNPTVQYLEESFEQENIQQSFEEERLFHELTPSERPEKWRLREMFPSYFEKDKREGKFISEFQDIANSNAIPEPASRYEAECVGRQRTFMTKDATLRTRAVPESTGKDRLGDDSQDNTSLYAVLNKASALITSYDRQKSVKLKSTHVSYHPSQPKERKFFPEDFEDLLCSSKSPEQASLNYNTVWESSIRGKVKTERLTEDSQDYTSLYAASNRTRTRNAPYERQENMKLKGNNSHDHPPSQAKERKFFPEDFEDILCPRKFPQKSSSIDNAAGEGSLDDFKHPSKIPKKACEKQTTNQSSLRDMNSLSLESHEIQPLSLINRLVQSSPPPNILRRQCHSKRESPRRTSS